jgi:hypothetical protein
MDEREDWRPKLFYSAPGPHQGLPEPFPAPTHIRRKVLPTVPPCASGSHQLQNVANGSQRAHAADKPPSPLEPEETADSPVEGHCNTHLSVPMLLRLSRLKRQTRIRPARIRPARIRPAALQDEQLSSWLFFTYYNLVTATNH